MATTRTIVSVGRSPYIYLVTWGPLASGETGDILVAPNLTDATVQAYGTFSGGASLAMRGSNDTGTSPTLFTLAEPDGTLISGWTAADGAQILESPYLFRPVITSGDGSTSITVILKIVSNAALSANALILKTLTL
jgi:hypothetical protein